MSSLWTPGGERPVGRSAPPGGDGPAQGGSESPPAGGQGPRRAPSEDDLAAIRDQLAKTPAAAVVTNHCLGLWELAALHLSLQPPQLGEAAVAIDALGAIIERLEGRLGEDEPTLRDALAQLRLAFVQVQASAAEGDHGG